MNKRYCHPRNPASKKLESGPGRSKQDPAGNKKIRPGHFLACVNPALPVDLKVAKGTERLWRGSAKQSYLSRQAHKTNSLLLHYGAFGDFTVPRILLDPGDSMNRCAPLLRVWRLWPVACAKHRQLFSTLAERCVQLVFARCTQRSAYVLVF